MFSYWDKPDLTPVATFLSEWRLRFPDFTILGDPQVESIIKELFPQYLEMYRAVRIPACKSDIAIALGLYQFGGLFVDCHCGVRDADAVRRLLTYLDQWEIILYDRSRVEEPRSIGDLFPLNSVLFARPNSSIMLRVAANGFRNLVAHRRREQERGFEPYDIWSLTGPGNLADTMLVSESSAWLRPEYLGKILFIDEGEQNPVARYTHYSYRQPDMHWSERQQHELLFDDAA
jgi:hypothetical protein